MKKFQRLSQKVLHSNPYLDYLDDEYIMPNGQRAHYYYIRSKNSVLVIPELADGRFLMVRQYRYIPQRWSLEFPGGAQKPEKGAQATAFDELLEETGYRAQKMERIGSFSPCIGLIEEVCEIFLARQMKQEKPQPEESEEIEICFLTAEEIEESIRSGELWSGMSQAAWLQYQLHRSKE